VSISALFFLVACGKEEENPVSISSIDLNPSSIDVGGSVIVTINATDEDGRILNYEFTANGGTFPDITDTTQNSATWTAPLTGGTYRITGRAYVGDDQDTLPRDIVVLSSDKPTITLIYPTEGIGITAVNNPGFKFSAFHSNGIKSSVGLIIELYADDNDNDYTNDTLIPGAVSSIVQTNTGDNQNFTFSFDLDLDSITGDHYLKYGVQSNITSIDSNPVYVHFTVEGVTTTY
jgi:hypothetical protein